MKVTCPFLTDLHERISKVLTSFNSSYSHCSFVPENMPSIERKKLTFKASLKEYYGTRMKSENILDPSPIFCCCQFPLHLLQVQALRTFLNLAGILRKPVHRRSKVEDSRDCSKQQWCSDETKGRRPE